MEQPSNLTLLSAMHCGWVGGDVAPFTADTFCHSLSLLYGGDTAPWKTRQCKLRT